MRLEILQLPLWQYTYVFEYDHRTRRRTSSALLEDSRTYDL
jgi:hypothetical protein